MTPQQIAERVVNGALKSLPPSQLQALAQAVLDANPKLGKRLQPTALDPEPSDYLRGYLDGLRRAAEIVQKRANEQPRRSYVYEHLDWTVKAIHAEIAKEQAQ